MTNAMTVEEVEKFYTVHDFPSLYSMNNTMKKVRCLHKLLIAIVDHIVVEVLVVVDIVVVVDCSTVDLGLRGVRNARNRRRWNLGGSSNEFLRLNRQRESLRGGDIMACT